MGFRDLLKNKDDTSQSGPSDHPNTASQLATNPEFTFIRSDTNTHEVIQPPSMRSFDDMDASYLAPGSTGKTQRRSLDVFRSGGRNRSTSDVSSTSSTGYASGGISGATSERKKLSQRLRLSRHPSTSDSVPTNLPEIRVAGEGDDNLDQESQWEKRATILAQTNELHRSRPVSPNQGFSGSASEKPGGKSGGASTKETDDDIQEAIKLHESGQLEQSTRMFGRLADPNGANNALSQVLYGLALRHGWGCAEDHQKAVTYLTKAASNAAVVENMALLAGQKKGGAAKGELVLAIFELANCFRQGWGIPKDPIAAKHYYETAANLGDTDAMNEVGWCYLEGFGCKKDKMASARYYRLAEKNGNKILGNSWIWKEKYNEDGGSGKK